MKESAKVAAERILADALATARGYWTEQEEAIGNEYTDKQKEAISKQMGIIADRLAKKLHYNGSWSN